MCVMILSGQFECCSPVHLLVLAPRYGPQLRVKIVSNPAISNTFAYYLHVRRDLYFVLITGKSVLDINKTRANADLHVARHRQKPHVPLRINCSDWVAGKVSVV